MKDLMKGLGWKGDKGCWSIQAPDGSISLMNDSGTIRITVWYNSEGSARDTSWEDQREIRFVSETGGRYREALRQALPTMGFKLAGTEVLRVLVATADALEAAKNKGVDFP